MLRPSRFSLCVALSVAITFGAGSSVSARDFSDTKGRKFAGELLSVVDGKATIKRTDGQTFTVPVETFSADDRKFMEEFAKKPQPLSFDVRFAKKKIGAEKKTTFEGTVSIEDWIYNVELKNRLSRPVDAAKVEYWCFRRNDSGQTRQPPAMQSHGTWQMEKLAPYSSAKFDTEAIQLVKSKLDADYIYRDGSDRKQSDGMGGLVIKVYQGETEVFRWATKDDLMPFVDRWQTQQKSEASKDAEMDKKESKKD